MMQVQVQTQTDIRWCFECCHATEHHALWPDVAVCLVCGSFVGPVEQRLAEAQRILAGVVA